MSDSEFIAALRARLPADQAGDGVYINLDEWQRLELLAKAHVRGAFYGQQLMVRRADLAGAIEAAEHTVAQHVTQELTK